MGEKIVIPKTRDQRDRVLTEQRNLKMAQSAHAYVRGNTRLFYEWLDAHSESIIPNGPPIWICGDCHVGNLGPVGSMAGEVEIQIRDLDQTVIGNPAHDLIRLGLSVAMAARGSDLPGVTTALMMESMAESYAQAIRPDDQGNEGEPPLPDPVHVVMRTAVARSWKHLARERLADDSPTIPIGKRFWPLTKTEKTNIAALFENKEIARLATMLRSRPDDSKVRMVDAAYWMKGCSSLGRLRYAVVLAVSTGEDNKPEYCLIDVKEAIPAVAPRHADAVLPKEAGARVVEGARHLSPYLGDRMVAAHLFGKAVFLRELLPQDLKLEIEHVSQSDAIEVAGFLAGIVGKAHARQLDQADALTWRKEVLRRRSKTIDAPSWLWSSVVDLVASHEAGYLEHCRRYALAGSRKAA
jgi:uncharacterized protein (DUF2252 family)